MKNHIVKFVPKDNNVRPVIHKIQSPDVLEPGFYRASVSFGAFSHGKRAGASQKDKECYRNTCCWSPIGLYHVKFWDEEEWKEENRRVLTSLGKYLNQQELDELDEEKMEIINHKSVYDFYDYIGFDRKKRKYVKQ